MTTTTRTAHLAWCDAEEERELLEGMDPGSDCHVSTRQVYEMVAGDRGVITSLLRSDDPATTVVWLRAQVEEALVEPEALEDLGRWLMARAREYRRLIQCEAMDGEVPPSDDGCPWWCTDQTSATHEWKSEGDGSWVRMHSRTVGLFDIAQMETVWPGGARELGEVDGDTTLERFTTAQDARELAEELAEVAAVMSRIEAGER